MQELRNIWDAFKNACKVIWEETCDMLGFDSGIDLGYPSGGFVPEETHKFVGGSECVVSHRQLLNRYTSLQLLEEIIKRQSEESE